MPSPYGSGHNATLRSVRPSHLLGGSTVCPRRTAVSGQHILALSAYAVSLQTNRTQFPRHKTSNPAGRIHGRDSLQGTGTKGYRLSAPFIPSLPTISVKRAEADDGLSSTKKTECFERSRSGSTLP